MPDTKDISAQIRALIAAGMPESEATKVVLRGPSAIMPSLPPRPRVPMNEPAQAIPLNSRGVSLKAGEGFSVNDLAHDTTGPLSSAPQDARTLSDDTISRMIQQAELERQVREIWRQPYRLK